MDKRYQIFISSTYKDLVKERRAASEAIIELECFPAGMESFPASSQSQFDYIKKVIDSSDYYILIVGGKYGSLCNKSISYTEMEFNYAKEKGIPVLAFVKRDINHLPKSKTESSAIKKKKLDEFRTFICTNHLVKMWDSVEELKGAVISSLYKEFSDNPKKGWIRARESDKYEVPRIFFSSKEPENAQVGDIWIGNVVLDGGYEG